MASAAPTCREDDLTPGDIKLRTLLTHPWTVADFMTFALQDKETGYYKTRAPLGQGGDFITAPEVSPLFGESVAVYLINAWQEAGRPNPFILLELGPGRGTLMADILHVARIAPDFLEACCIHLVECSPVLRARQGQTLSSYTPTWHDHLEDALQNKMPLFLVANEFFDALPVHQYVCTPQGWRERGVCLGAHNLLEWTTLDTPICHALPGGALDAFKEISPITLALFEQILVHLKENGGVAFICDYGYETGGKDTLQGVRNHAYSHVLTQVGETDLSAHVDFGTLMEKARAKTSIGARLLTQRDFLMENFIDVRAQQLLKKAPTREDREKILQGFARLINDDAMGSLFKVLLLQGPAA